MKRIPARIFAPGVFPSGNPVQICEELNTRFASLGTRAILMNRDQALAVIWNGVPVTIGCIDEVQRNSLKIAPVSAYLAKYFDEAQYFDENRAFFEQYDNLSMRTPDTKYNLEVWLPANETRGKFIQFGANRRYREGSSVGFRLVYRKTLSEQQSVSFEKFVFSWFDDMSEVGVAGESLRGSLLKLDQRTDREISFRLELYSAVTFPWVELYLRLRSEFDRGNWPSQLMYVYDDRRTPPSNNIA